MDKIVRELSQQQNIRGNLSDLRKLMKDSNHRERLLETVQNNDGMWLSFLQSDDPKTRKNAALLLGDISYENAADLLWETYCKEQTLFVRASYLEALRKINAEIPLDEAKDRIASMESMEISDENRKHMEEELRALRNLVMDQETPDFHKFFMKGQHDVLLTTNPIHREVVKRMITRGESKLHPLGVCVRTDSLEEILALRTYREMLFIISTGGLLEAEPVKVAEALMASGLIQLLDDLHEGDGAYYFRVECKHPMELSKRSAFCRKLAAQLERTSQGRLINSTSHYEVEIRLIANKEGKFLAALKCYTCQDSRFAYRKNAIASSIHPSTAALIMELAKPYLRTDAQIMDPFCGVGTMLMERNIAVAAREIYATDIFGDAISYGRENADLAKCNVHFIHRDFFDFSHDYLFDEMITNMPVRGKKTREEMEELYTRFFAKIPEHMKSDGILILYTNEVGYVKKQLRLHKEFVLLQETLMQNKGDYYLLVIGMKG